MRGKIYVEEGQCHCCEETGVCVWFSDHSEVDTDEIDMSICPKCLAMAEKKYESNNTTQE